MPSPQISPRSDSTEQRGDWLGRPTRAGLDMLTGAGTITAR
ncbi:hypothetical protein [Alloactinosynnema sp. L-07]|nr:hypothetical protein [Alloactinosynnema sp. L-07]